MMRHGFERMQAPTEDGGSSIYLRLTTRQIEQLDRDLQGDAHLQADILKGAYWHVNPTAATQHVIVFSGVIAPEARDAQQRLGDSTALLQITSYDLLLTDWMQNRDTSHAMSLLHHVPK